MNEKKLPLNSLHLKVLAAAAMLVDHLGFTLFPFARWMRCVGRLAFPIFCFLMAEGCARTRDRKRYAARLLGFAVLSEPAFDLMCSGVWFTLDEQNVLWTLLLGALVCWAMDWAGTRPELWQRLPADAALAVGFLLGQWGSTDYGGWGVLLVALFYMTREIRGKWAVQLAGLGLFCWFCTPWRIELLAVLALIPICLYNGERGFSSRAVQYGFYAFYPAHILILGMLARYVW